MSTRDFSKLVPRFLASPLVRVNRSFGCVTSLLLHVIILADSPEENDKFAKAQRLPFPLLTDASSILRKTFGIPNDLLGLLPGRQTYVIDKSGERV
jgi:peroxiredoxin